MGGDAEYLEGAAKLQRGAVKHGRIEGADAEVEGGLDERYDMPLDVHVAATGSGSESKTVTAEGKAISGNFSNSWHELSRVSGDALGAKILRR